MNQKEKGWVETFAKVGYAAKGLVYFLMGTLTAMAAIGIGGEKASNTDAFHKINTWPGGGFLLALLGIGLLCYSLWRLIQAFRDTENKGTDIKGLLKRGAFMISGALYGALSFLAFKIAIGSQNSSGDGSREKEIASELLGSPLGTGIAIIIGLITIGNGLFQIIKAYSGSFMKEVKGVPAGQYATLIKAGKVGFAARGVVFSIIGFLFLKAIWSNNPQKAEGTEGAFTFLQTSPLGAYLMAAVAIGLMCYGVFMLVQARYSNIHVS